jgi:hypothetical protein
VPARTRAPSLTASVSPLHHARPTYLGARQFGQKSCRSARIVGRVTCAYSAYMRRFGRILCIWRQRFSEIYTLICVDFGVIDDFLQNSYAYKCRNEMRNVRLRAEKCGAICPHICGQFEAGAETGAAREAEVCAAGEAEVCAAGEAARPEAVNFLGRPAFVSQSRRRRGARGRREAGRPSRSPGRGRRECRTCLPRPFARGRAAPRS